MDFKPNSDIPNEVIPDLFDFNFEMFRNYKFYLPENNFIKILENLNFRKSITKKKHSKHKSQKDFSQIFNDPFKFVNSNITETK